MWNSKSARGPIRSHVQTRPASGKASSRSPKYKPWCRPSPLRNTSDFVSTKVSSASLDESYFIIDFCGILPRKYFTWFWGSILDETCNFTLILISEVSFEHKELRKKKKLEKEKFDYWGREMKTINWERMK
jgi:hypothetical protein